MSDPKKPSNPSKAMFGLDDPPPHPRQPQGGASTHPPAGGGPYSFGQAPPAPEAPPYGAAPGSRGAAYQETGATAVGAPQYVYVQAPPIASAPAAARSGSSLRWLVIALLVLS